MKNNIQQAEDDEEVQIIAPDFSLKKKIGEDINIREILSPEVVQRSQQVIDSQQGEFIEWAFKDIATLTHAYHHVKRNPDDSLHFKKLVNMAFSLKCQAGTFGFNLASAVAKSLYDYCNNHPKLSNNDLTVVGKHVESLTVIFQQSIKGDGGPVGQELMGTLAMLIEKYNKK